MKVWEDIEDMTLELTEALFQSLKAQKLIRNKLADLESKPSFKRGYSF